jgi:hypothetical protein
MQEGRLAVNLPVHNVIYEPFPDGEWAALDLLCQRYFEPDVGDQPVLSVSDFVVPAPDPLYVPPTLVRRLPDAQRSAQELAASLELGLERPVDAEALAVKSRTLIIGRPGSGKTELLRKAAAEVPADERPVYIRLSSVREPIGDPVSVVVGWARSAQPAKAQRELSADDLDAQRFHFLLDGLDEVNGTRQAQLATRIGDIARELPQHRFTVTSRPIPAAETFDPLEWERLELTTSSDWRRAYLKLAGVTEDNLVAAVPAMNDLDELLNLPFFLAAVVELYQVQALPPGGGLMAVTQALIDQALSADDITPVRDAVRPWLRDVAFTMQAAGRASLRRDELDLVALPAGLNLGPDEDVVDLLTRRSLLERASGEVRFVHRLVGDALAAEKLIDLGPGTPGLLDMVAPATATVTGARSEWMVVLAFAGSISADWRAAVRQRDPMAAARTVPPTADVQERRDAAQVLWRAYVSSRVWMHYSGGARLLQDDEACGRLLTAGDLPDVVDEILGGIYNPSPQVRSNAIDVLAAGRLDHELEPLVRATLSGEPEEVVRRQATADAVHRNLVSAFPLIRHRALTSDENLEVQTCTALGVRLAPDEDLVQFALDLVEAGRTRYAAVERVTYDRLGPDAALIVLRRQAERDGPSPLRENVLKKLNDELPHTDEVAEQLAFIVASGRDRHIVLDRLLAHPDAAMRGLVAALHLRPRRWHEVAPLTVLLPESAIDAAEFQDEQLRDLLKRVRAPRPGAESEDQTAPPVADEPESEPEREPTLAELLDRSDEQAESQLLQRAMALSHDVDDLGNAHRRNLQRRLRGWWPTTGFAASITENRITWPAHACLSYGSRLRPPLTDVDWGEVAQVRMPHEGKNEWLHARYRRKAAVAAAQNLDADTAEPWVRLCGAIPGMLPLDVVNAAAVHITTADVYLREVLNRLLAERRIPALRKLAKVSGEVGEAAAYFVARAGDVRAQRRCLVTLMSEFGTDKAIHSDDLSWMQGITDEALLPGLFDALVAAYRHRNTDYNDAMTPIHEAIRRIGGADAIRRYDDLMAQDPTAFDGVQFERHQRDNLVDDLLCAAGEQSRAPLLADLGLPSL